MRAKRVSLAVLAIMAVVLVQGQTAGKKAPASKPPANEQEILEEIQALETSLREAFEEGNSIWWNQHLDEHYSGLNADGKVLTKVDAIRLYGSPEVKYDEMVVSDVAARIFNGDCVVATGRTAVKGSYGGQDFSGDYYFVHVWIKNGTDWKLASSQATKLPSTKSG